MLLFDVSVCVRLGRVREGLKEATGGFQLFSFFSASVCGFSQRNTDRQRETEGREGESEAGLPPVSVTVVVVFPSHGHNRRAGRGVSNGEGSQPEQ